MRASSTIRFAFAAAAALAAAGCASDDGASGGAPASAFAEPAPSVEKGPRAIETFPSETRVFMFNGLKQFTKGDPQWETTRAEWLAKGPDEVNFLVTTMWAALLKFQTLGQLSDMERVRYELAKIGEPAIPILAEFLTGGNAYTSIDPETGTAREMGVGDMARGEASQVLSLIGAPSVPAVRDALAATSSKAGKRWALETLGYLGDRGGADAVEPLLQYARSEDDVLRADAVHAMRFCHDDATRGALLAALEDGDALVRKRAADALMNRREGSAVPALRAAAERARADAKLAEAGEMTRAASWIEQHAK
jgi:hypothetical protein